MYESAGFMTFEHTKVEDCLYYSLSPLCTVFTIMYLKQIVFLEYVMLQLFCSLLFFTFVYTFQYIQGVLGGMCQTLGECSL